MAGLTVVPVFGVSKALELVEGSVVIQAIGIFIHRMNVMQQTNTESCGISGGVDSAALRFLETLPSCSIIGRGDNFDKGNCVGSTGLFLADCTGDDGCDSDPE